MTRARAVRLTAVALAITAFTAACGSNGDDTTSADTGAAGSPTESSGSMSPSKTGGDLVGAAAVTSAAATTRAVLTAQLEEHVYLAGIATGTALEQGPDSAAFKAAAGTLDANSVALAETVGSVYGKAGGDQFLALWRKHIGFFVDYTVGAATKDDAKKSTALAALDGYRADFGAFIESATEGELPKAAVADELKPHVATLTAAIDAQAAKSPKQFELLKEAATHMPMTAGVLAGAIDAQKDLDGDTKSPASEARTALTAELEEHVYLAGIATGTALAKGPESPEYAAAAAALDVNSVELSAIVGSVYGKAGGDQFLALWRKHIGFFVDYTIGAATKDDAKKAKAVADLDGYRQDFGAFLESATEGKLTKAAVADELVPHVTSLAAAVDAQAAKDPKQFDLLRAAAGHMPMTAEVLATAIADQKQLAG